MRSVTNKTLSRVFLRSVTCSTLQHTCNTLQHTAEDTVKSLLAQCYTYSVTSVMVILRMYSVTSVLVTLRSVAVQCNTAQCNTAQRTFFSCADAKSFVFMCSVPKTLLEKKHRHNEDVSFVALLQKQCCSVMGWLRLVGSLKL